MSIAGKYLLSNNENYGEWLAAVGIPADRIARLEQAKPLLEVNQNGNDLTVKTIAGDKDFTNTITLGKDSKAGLPGGIEYTLNMNLSGSTLSGTFTMAGKTGNATVEFTPAGLTQTMTCCGKTAKRVYARQ